jgi:benzoyl-CoA reductase/2-hydroxyglutaryl-CoA dehydratase subunit BcrC/BadD/HgdB
MPHVTDDASVEFTREILRIFVSSLERFTGTPISDSALTESIKVHNENRRLMRELYGLRKTNPPLISGVEMMQVLVAAMGLPVHESSALVSAVTDEVRREKPISGGKKRIMLIGDQIDDVAIAEIVENADASLVMDNISIGSKMYWEDVDATTDPLEGLALRYLRKLKLPTTIVGGGVNYREDLETRFGHLRQFIKDFSVDGVILLVYKYCDPYGFEVPAVKKFIEETGTPVLYLEDEYSTSSLARVKTRVEAFLEMIA